MDRHEALKMLPELSAGCLDAKTEDAVRRWVAECPRCKAEWESLQSFLGALEAVPQDHLTETQSRQMWSRCNEALFDRIESQRLQQSLPQQSLSKSPALWSWARSQPRWGWAMLGGAVAVLGATILAPDNSPSAPGAPVSLASVGNSGGPGVLQSFGRPPSYAATMVDHHAQMGADPFSDRVGSSLVSYSASYAVSGVGAGAEGASR